MFKKNVFFLILFFWGVSCAAWGQPVQPAAVAGLVTVNGTQVTQASDPGYVYTITRPDGSNFISHTGTIAEDADGLNSSNAYQISIPIYEAAEQQQGAKPGEDAIIHIRLNGKELTVKTPSNGEITIGEIGSTARIDLSGEDAAASLPPTADAGQDQEVEGNTVVTLDGSKSSDPDGGNNISYQWRQTQGESVVLSNETSQTPSFTAPDPSAAQQFTLVFELTVTAANNTTAKDAVVITVLSSQKIAPIADAGPSQTVKEGVTVTLDGSNSTDPDSEDGNGITSFSWFQTGGTAVVLSPAADGRAAFETPEVGSQGESLTFELTVTDKDNLQDTDSTIVNVVSVNNPPAADAGSSQNVHAGDTVTLNGSGSTDPDPEDQGNLTFQWVQIIGTTVTLSDAAHSMPQFTAPNVGDNGESLKFELSVTDPGGLISTDSVTVNIISVNQPPVSDAGPDQTVSEGQTVALDGSNSRDPEQNALIYLWSQLAGSPVTLSNAKSAAPQFTAPAAGEQTLTFELTVMDDKGLQHSDRIRVYVTDTGAPPKADAGEDQNVKTGEKVMLDGSKSEDGDGFIAQYQWMQLSGDAQASLSNPVSPTPTFIAPSVGSSGDTLRFKLTVTDNDGLTDEDETLVTIMPHSGGLEPPEADASASSEDVYEGKSGILDGTKSRAPSGEIVSYEWKQVYGPSVTINDPDADITVFTAPSVNNSSTVLTFRLTVTDSNALKDDDEVQVKIKDYGPGPGDTDKSCFISSLLEG